ncbi:MAG: hypothetical protein AAFU68_09785 [Pseudomonadota bacterium]
MPIEDALLQTARFQGLSVGGPFSSEADTGGWANRYVIAAGSERYAGSTVYLGPLFWVFEDEGYWFTQASHNEAGGADFFRRHNNAEDAVGWVISQLMSAREP